MVRKVFTLLFASVLVFGLAAPVFAQEGSKPAEGKAAKEGRVEGMVTRSNKDNSTLTVRNRDTNVEKIVHYDSSTQWTKQGKPGKQDDVKQGSFVILVGHVDDSGVLHATRIDLRRPR